MPRFRSLASVGWAGVVAVALIGGCASANKTASSSASGTCASGVCAVQPATQASGATTAPALVGFANTLCPVEQNEIDPSFFITYEGKKIGFCCDDCREKFLLNPDKYLATMK